MPVGTGRIVGPEDAIFAQVDGVGALDIIVAAEGDFQVTVFFGPADPDDAGIDTAWTRMDIAESITEDEAAMRVKFEDINGDGAKDIVVGGKEVNRNAGVVYYTSPTPTIGSSWDYHLITPAGWVQEMQVVDMNGDGRPRHPLRGQGSCRQLALRIANTGDGRPMAGEPRRRARTCLDRITRSRRTSDTTSGSRSWTGTATVTRT